MKCSVAIATYNGEAYLQKQLDSLASQSRPPDEVVISDDRSTDNTLQIAQEFQKKVLFNVVIHQNEEQKGFIQNFDKALSLTTGDLVFLCDQDDVWFKQKLESVERYAIEHPAYSVFMNDALLTDGDLNRTDLTLQQQIRSLGRPMQQFITGCCTAVRRSHLERILPIPSDYPSHDGWIVNLADALEEKMVVSEVLQLYRRHGSNTSNSTHGQLKKMNRWITIQTMFRRMLTNGERQSLQHDQIKMNVLERRFQDLINKMNERQAIRLKRMLDGKKSYMEFQKKRLEIRNQPAHRRFRSILHHYKNGDYKLILGGKSALRDTLGSMKDHQLEGGASFEP